MGLSCDKFSGSGSGSGRRHVWWNRFLGIATVVVFTWSNYQSSTSLNGTSPATASASAMDRPGSTYPKSEDVAFRREDYKYCQIIPEPQVDQHRVRMEQVAPAMDLWYQCSGQPYNEYMDLVWTQVVQAKHQADPTSLWGKRPTPVPPGKTILVMGNSHTRQVLTSLLCQYKGQILHATELAPVPGKKNVAMTFRLQHNVTIYVLVNHPFVYSKRWHRTLTLDLLKMPLEKLDAIVLGSFNSLSESHKTSFLQTTLRYQKEMPQHKVNFLEAEPPHLEQVAQVYGGPLIWMSMFALSNQATHDKAMAAMASLQFQNVTRSVVVDKRPIHRHDLHARNNIRAVYGRRYIDSLLGGTECSSDSYDIVKTCLTNRTSKRYANGHKCVGRQGGFPDLIAWDLSEALYDLLDTTTVH
jgi:hypothetical protein